MNPGNATRLAINEVRLARHAPPAGFEDIRRRAHERGPAPSPRSKEIAP